MSKWTAAFALLGVLIVFGAAGTLALDASYTQTTETRNDSATYSDESPPAVDTGYEASSGLATIIPYLAWIGVPMGILGIITLGGVALTRSIDTGGGFSR